jgi:AraC-like DNA-binding protein
MTGKSAATSQQPTVIKYSVSRRQGVQATLLHRHAIGYVLQGRRYVYQGDARQEYGADSVYYLRAGSHYIEDVPEGDKPFVQIVFFYDTDQLNRILSRLHNEYRISIGNTHSCAACRSRNEVSFPAWGTLKEFFRTVDRYLSDNIFGSDEAAGSIKLTELVYLLLRNDDCCLKRCLLDNIDLSMADFEQLVREHIFSDQTIAELADKCKRSMTSFKNDFRRHFNEAPHQWFIRQRLLHARLQLISTNRPVADIGREAGYQNPSHFIKSFKKEFTQTPAAYRRAHLISMDN